MKEGKIFVFIHSKSKTFLAFCFCFILGVGVWSASEREKDWLFLLYLAGLGLAFGLMWYWRRLVPRFGLLCGLFFVLGGIRFLLSVPDTGPGSLSFYNGTRQTLSVIVVEEPEIKENKVKYILAAENGRAQMIIPLYPRYDVGARLRVECDLAEPQNAEGSEFNYRAYMARRGIWSECKKPRVLTMVAPKRSPSAYLLAFKEKMGERIDKLWPEPQSALMAGLLYGARGSMPSDLLEDFSRVGITHIIAISGYNISIIAAVMMGVLIGIGLPRPRAFWWCVGGIILFVIFTGASASVVRAGIMGIMVLLAQQLGRMSRVGNALAFTAALMLLFNPYVLVWDAGFQLSFLATMGLVYLSEPISVILRLNRLSEQWGFIVEPLSCTLSAIVATLPLILYQFGRLSVVAPLVNILALWIIPYLMFFGFIALVASFIFFPFGQATAWIAGLGLKYVIILARWFGGLSFAAVEFYWPLWAVFLSYAALIFLVARYKRRQ